MTRSERIRLAEKAGFSGVDARSVHVERLVALVEAAERQACAGLCEDIEMEYQTLLERTAHSDAKWKSFGAATCVIRILARGDK